MFREKEESQGGLFKRNCTPFDQMSSKHKDYRGAEFSFFIYLLLLEIGRRLFSV